MGSTFVLPAMKTCSDLTSSYLTSISFIPGNALTSNWYNARFLESGTFVHFAFITSKISSVHKNKFTNLWVHEFLNGVQHNY